MKTFLSELKRIISERYKSGEAFLISGDVAKLATIFSVSVESAEASRIRVESGLLEEWQKQTVNKKPSVIDKNSKSLLSGNSNVVKIATEVKKSGYARVGEEIQKNISDAVKSGLRQNMDVDALAKKINREFNTGKARAATTVRTARLGKIRADYLINALQNGFTVFRFTGPATDRSVCEEYIGKEFTIDEMLNHPDVQGLSFAIFMGGFNCRHRWQAVR